MRASVNPASLILQPIGVLLILFFNIFYYFIAWYALASQVYLSAQ